MSRTDDRTDKKLPVTGEVGSEGGSYADSTMQVAEFEGDVGRTAEAAEPAGADAETRDSIKPANE
ncbi:MAG TPA: hypothetical protein VM364_07245 [Vicinamibacterales bacterium]|nr:hypothetical protein [Vicinamibacterales bacterium]